MKPRDIYIKQQVVTLQCRGPDGNLERDVGVLIEIENMDEENKIVSCPYHQRPDKCKVRKTKLMEGSEDHARCFLY